METVKQNSSRLRTNLLDDNANLSAFRRRNSILILVLMFLIVSLIVVLAVLVAYFVRDFQRQQSQQSIPNSAVRAFCLASSDYPWCEKSFAARFSLTSRVNPSQLFTYSLHVASDKLENLVSLLSSLSDINKPAVNFVNTCSNSSIEAKTQIAATLKLMRLNPFVEAQSDEERRNITKLMNATRENLVSCMGEVEKADEMTVAMAEVRAVVYEVMDYVDAGADFVRRYDYVLAVWDSYNVAVYARRMSVETQFGIVMMGSQLLYVFFMFLCLFRIR